MTRIAIAVSCAAFLLAGCDLSSSSRKEKDAAPVHSGGAVPTIQPTEKKKVKKGEVASAAPAVDPSQPPVPPLPADVDLGTTNVELGAHALMVAQEEHAQGILGGKSISDRHLYLYLAWLPQMTERQAMLQKIVDERGVAHQADVAEATRVARNEATMDETEERLSKAVAAERRKTVPVLTPDEVDILE
ncbi:MAG TPA: hypothetical protein VEL07_03220 [Planctomycetota bacterium]|nr:hypothetical protein [Planctomycetota bacterium]